MSELFYRSNQIMPTKYLVLYLKHSDYLINSSCCVIILIDIHIILLLLLTFVKGGKKQIHSTAPNILQLLQIIHRGKKGRLFFFCLVGWQVGSSEKTTAQYGTSSSQHLLSMNYINYQVYAGFLYANKLRKSKDLLQISVQ